MSGLQQNDAPEGHYWVEDLSVVAKKDLETIKWLCEKEYIQGVKIGDRWAVRVIRTTTTQAGTAIVRDLKAGKDITIGSVIGQYVVRVDGKDPIKDTKERIAQNPIRLQVDGARYWLRMVWILLGGGAALFLIGLGLTWPIAALVVLRALSVANQALEMAQKHGDQALLEETQYIHNQAKALAIILWGIMLIALIGGLISAFLES
ncbi:MAG: hypothetical protein KC418_15475 [Anaerolineales bacterium]|nr:hypothetical protein [Anaerolineales bacterium]